MKKIVTSRIAETYLRLQGEDGTWYLKMNETDGSPVSGNRLVPTGVRSWRRGSTGRSDTTSLRWRLVQLHGIGCHGTDHAKSVSSTLLRGGKLQVK